MSSCTLLTPLSWKKAVRLGVLAFLPVLLAACVSTAPPPQATARRIDPAYLAMYGARPDEQHPLPATDISEVDPRFLRREVAYSGSEEPGTIVVDTAARYLYLVRENGRAVRYGIGVGKAGFGWTGETVLERRARWPTWTPPPEMIKRTPSLEKWKDGQPGGLSNPLGARALYLYRNGHDTGFRIHGTPEWRSIGTNSSAGCFRMIHQDVMDLYERAPNGAKVIVR